jgi:hypothetical protein
VLSLTPNQSQAMVDTDKVMDKALLQSPKANHMADMAQLLQPQLPNRSHRSHHMVDMALLPQLQSNSQSRPQLLSRSHHLVDMAHLLQSQPQPSRMSQLPQAKDTETSRPQFNFQSRPQLHLSNPRTETSTSL